MRIEGSITNSNSFYPPALSFNRPKTLVFDNRITPLTLKHNKHKYTHKQKISKFNRLFAFLSLQKKLVQLW